MSDVLTRVARWAAAAAEEARRRKIRLERHEARSVGERSVIAQLGLINKRIAHWRKAWLKNPLPLLGEPGYSELRTLRRMWKMTQLRGEARSLHRLLEKLRRTA